MNEDALAAMYPSMAPSTGEAPVADGGLDDADALANAIFPSMRSVELAPEELSPAVQALRDLEPARKMFKDEVVYGTALEAVTHDLEPDAKALAMREWAGILADCEIPSTEAQTLVGLAVRQGFPSEDQSLRWEAASHDSLVSEFGAGADTALADAKLLVSRDPRLAKFLDETGLGDHPEIVLKAARIAREQIASGKLKRKG
ncbi:MAG: hypothetical protein IV107_03885 [Paucibacter sp.]|nr:hypothetical protein [Roseateles sp.]